MGCTNSKDGPAPGAVDLQPWDQADQFLQAARVEPDLQATKACAGPAVVEARRLSEPSITSVIETPTVSFSSKLQPEERSHPRASSPPKGDRASSPPNGSPSSSQSRRRCSRRAVLPGVVSEDPAPPAAPVAPDGEAEATPVLAPALAVAAVVPDSRSEEVVVVEVEEEEVVVEVHRYLKLQSPLWKSYALYWRLN